MEYERMQNPSLQGGGGGGGVSPSKLRLVLLGLDRRCKEEEEHECRRSLRSETDDRCVDSSEVCKDVDVVCSPPERSAATEEMAGAPPRMKDFFPPDAKIMGPQGDESLQPEALLSSAFEFQRAERAQQHRSVLVPLFSKPAPSKWDDAQKWIASPTSNRSGKPATAVPKKMMAGIFEYANRRSATKVLEVTEEPDTKGVDFSQTKKEVTEKRTSNWVSNSYPLVESYAKPALVLDNLVASSAGDRGSSILIHDSTSIAHPAPTVRSVSMRDTGTAMTPVTSHEPSRTVTPVRAATPIHSSTSRSSTPARAAPFSRDLPTVLQKDDSDSTGFAEREFQIKARKELMVHGMQLDKVNIATWTRKEDEYKDESAALKRMPVVQETKHAIDIRAAAWEEAEKAKYLARFKREEIKIQAWEDHQKAKAEAERNKIEIDVERMRLRSQEKLMNKLAMTRHKGEEKRAAAEAKRNQQSSRTAQQVEYIRRTGRVPPSFSFWGCCR